MLDLEDKDEILDAIGDIHLLLHKKLSVEPKFQLITSVLYRHTPAYNTLLESFDGICTLLVNDDINEYIDMIDCVLSDIIELVVYLSLFELTQENKHIIYEPTVQAMNQLVINITGGNEACEVEFF